MSFVVSFAGLFVGYVILSTVVDILYFDIPFTLRMGRTNQVDTANVFLGSIASLLIRIAILAISCFIVRALVDDYILYFAIALLAGG